MFSLRFHANWGGKRWRILVFLSNALKPLLGALDAGLQVLNVKIEGLICKSFLKSRSKEALLCIVAVVIME